MATLRRSQLFACLLALALFAANLPASAAVWQCRHAVRLVSASLLAAPAAMPCRMADAPMPHMACCPASSTSVKSSAAKPSSPRSASETAPPCRPTLNRLAALPCARMSEAQFSLRLTLSLRQRPPPVSGTHSPPSRTLGLRAPPAA